MHGQREIKPKGNYLSVNVGAQHVEKWDELAAAMNLTRNALFKTLLERITIDDVRTIIER